MCADLADRWCTLYTFKNFAVDLVSEPAMLSAPGMALAAAWNAHSLVPSGPRAPSVSQRFCVDIPATHGTAAGLPSRNAVGFITRVSALQAFE
jgi:hypothetical protein